MGNKNLDFRWLQAGKLGHAVSPSASVAKTKLFLVRVSSHSFFSLYVRKPHLRPVSKAECPHHSNPQNVYCPTLAQTFWERFPWLGWKPVVFTLWNNSDVGGCTWSWAQTSTEGLCGDGIWWLPTSTAGCQQPSSLEVINADRLLMDFPRWLFYLQHYFFFNSCGTLNCSYAFCLWVQT